MSKRVNCVHSNMGEIKAPQSKQKMKYLGEVGVLSHVYDLSKMVQKYWQAGRSKNRLALLTQASTAESRGDFTLERMSAELAKVSLGL